MKKIIYVRPDGGLTVVHPVQGARIAHSIKLKDGTELKLEAPAPVDTFLRVWPVDGATADWAETEDEFVARIRAKDVPADATNVQLVDEDAIPADRTFRDAWMAGAGRVEHDMSKCLEIQRNRLREMRAPLFKRLDVDFMRAIEAGDAAAQATIAEQRQALRDVTADPRLEAAATPEELKLIVPDALKQPAMGISIQAKNAG